MADGFLDTLKKNFTGAVSKEGLLNTGLFVAAGAVAGGFFGGWGALPLLIGAAGGFLATATTGVNLIGRQQETQVAANPNAAEPQVRARAEGAAPAEQVNSGLPIGLAGGMRAPTGGPGLGNT